MAADSVVLGIIIGTLFAIVYSLRVLILLERRIARMDLNIESLTNRILREELIIEREEKSIERRLGMKRANKAPGKSTRKKSAKKSSKKAAKKATKKKAAKKSAKKRKR